MPRLTPLSAREVIRKLRALGFEGPYAGGRHSRMVHPLTQTVIPSSIHRKDMGVGLIREIIRQAGTTPDEWLEL